MTAPDPAAISAALAAIRSKIAAAGSAATLVAVAKTHGPDAVLAALEAGQRAFGENRVQEAMAKYPPLRAAYPDLELHLIGPLQTNKVREAVAAFDVIQTLDRPKLAASLAAEFARGGRRVRLFVQVNTGAEPQKAGILPQDADAFLAECRDAHGLAVEGLMCIPPADEPAAPHFALLRQIARRNALAGLSMGMSGDYATALALGATHIRVGSAIFGARA
jgi:pyridoxal phosphate enzyme (YggS family)